MKEQWKELPAHPKRYISNHGRIKSLVSGREKVLKIHKSVNGYPIINLYADGRNINYRVHSLVLTHFKGERPEGMECCHNDGNKENNRVDNLRWDTHENNLEDIQRPKKHVNNEFAKARKTLGHSRKSIAPLLGVHWRTIEAYEQNRRNPSKSVLMILNYMFQKMLEDKCRD